MIVFLFQLVEHTAEAKVESALILEHELFLAVAHRQQRPVERFVEISMGQIERQNPRVEVSAGFELMSFDGCSDFWARHFKPG